MTPDKRLDQIEPILADVALKTDRLIESSGQILDIATRVDTNARIAAKGIVDLTAEMRQQFGRQQTQIDLLKADMNDRFGQVDDRFDRVDQRLEQVDQRFDSVNQRFDSVDQRFDSVNQRFDRVDQRFEQVIIEQAELRKEMNMKFAQVAQTQEQILTLLLDRLK
jgi:chromosome segregation ATPase